MKVLKSATLSYTGPGSIEAVAFVWFDDGEITIRHYTVPKGVLSGIQENLEQRGYQRYPYGNVWDCTLQHPNCAELDRIPEPGARLMWRVKNKRYLAFARDKYHAWSLRDADPRLKYGRVEEVLNLYPSKIKYGEIYEVSSSGELRAIRRA